jgi:uncharacterized protein (DUF1697 family)
VTVPSVAPERRMRRYVLLLRAVNVGGRSVPMAQLRAVLTAAGFAEVSTYIQSGNVIVASPSDNPVDVGTGVVAAIEASLGITVAVVVLTADELAEVCRNDPFDDREDPGARHVTFLGRVPDPARVEAIDPRAGAPDEFVYSGRWIYIWCLSGYGTTGLSNRFFERSLGVPATTRNWRTVRTLARMATG